MKKNRLPIKLAILSIMTIAVFCIAFSWYNGELRNKLEASTQVALLEISQQMVGNFNTKFEKEMTSIKMLAALAKDVDEGGIDRFLKAAAKQSQFESLGIARLDGKSISSDEIENDISQRDYFKKAVAGETAMSEPLISKKKNEKVIAIASPIMDGGKVQAVLFATYLADELSQFLDMPFFEGEGYAYIAKSDGKVIAKTSNEQRLSDDNVYETLSRSSFELGDDFAKIKSNVNNGLTGHSHYSLGDNSRVAIYLPIGINDWYFYSVVPQAVITEQFNSILSSTWILIAIIIVVIALLMLFIVLSQGNYYRTTRKIAYTDSLTGFGNINKFEIDAREYFDTQKGRSAIIVLDVDKMKVFNDTFGFERGNELLKKIAQTINDNLFKGEPFARTGADEFCMLMRFDSNANLLKRMEAILKSIDDEFHGTNNQSYNLVLCAGVYVVENSKETIHALTDRARYVHKTTKGKPVSNVAFYDESMKKNVTHQKCIENRMHNALKNDEFLVYIQPKYELEGEQVAGGEALVRWQTADIGMIFPNDFIPLFEKNGFVTELDQRMFENVCKIIAGWIKNDLQPVTISVNFSRIHLNNPLFVEGLCSIAKKYEIPTKYLEIELTETAVIDNETALNDVIDKLHNAGFSISIDDFGSGYSSLGLLKNSPVDVVKLDSTFFTEYNDKQRADTVISSVINMVKKLNLYTVAEGVETLEHIKFLKELNCDIVQGYYYAKPMPADEFSKFLKKIGGTTNA